MATEFNVDLPSRFEYDSGISVEENLQNVDAYIKDLHISIEDIFRTLYTRVSDVADRPTADNIATVDEDGNVIDSGKDLSTDGTLGDNSDNSVPTEKAVKTYADNLSGFPSGGIIMWSGAISAIPTGWVLCDGTNGTPNLTDRFIIHADADSGGANDVGNSGGSKTISLANLPAHTHGNTGAHTHNIESSFKSGTGFSGFIYSTDNGEEFDRSTTSAGAHTHASVGSGSDYLPKYYALAYIMKT